MLLIIKLVFAATLALLIQQSHAGQYRRYGVFILCEKTGYEEEPEVKVVTDKKMLSIDYTGDCSRRRIYGRFKYQYGPDEKNHAALWSDRRDDWEGLKTFQESIFLCKEGQVKIVASTGRVRYNCGYSFDAHVVEFQIRK